MQTLGKPQLPAPEPLEHPKDWPTIGHNFKKVEARHRALVLYLQKYLYNIWAQIIPANLIPVAATQASYSVGATEGFIAASASTGADIPVALPQATGSGRTLVILKADNNAHNVVVTPHGTDTINGGVSVTLSIQYDVLRIIDGMTGIWFKW